MFKKSLVALLIITALLSACSSSAKPIASPSQPEIAPNAPAIDSSGGARQSGDSYSGAGKGSNYSGSPSVDRLVIRNATLTIIVADPIKSMDGIGQMADGMGGFVVTSNSYKVTIENGGQAPEATITVRVPAAKLNDALAQIKQQVKNASTDVLSENVSGQDVTKEYTDLNSQLTNLQDAEAQLREIMASATKTEDVLNVFNQLTQIRGQIEVIQGQIKYYQDSAEMSAINVTIKALASVAPLTIGRWQPVGVARDALQTTLSGFKFLANAVIWLILFALPIGLVIFIPLRLLWALLKRLRKPRTPRPTAPPAAPTAAD